MISNCGKDERGSYSGGTAGDQTGAEYRLINWFNRPWDCVLRHPDPSVRSMISKLATSAAQNDNIGYDQSERLTFWTQLTLSGYDPSKISVPCEADCSSSTCAIIKAVGFLLNDSRLKNIQHSLATWDMRNALQNAGFSLLTDSKYLTGASYLLAGDVLLNEDQHAAINVTDGAYAEAITPVETQPIVIEPLHNPAKCPGNDATPITNINTPLESKNFSQGDLVNISEGASWWNGGSVPSWVFPKSWYVLSVNGDRVVLGRSEDGAYNVMSPIHSGYLNLLKSARTKNETQSLNDKSSESELSGTYTVEKGDTLWGISERWCGKGWKYTEIMKANGLKSITIKIGQKLILPEKE